MKMIRTAIPMSKINVNGTYYQSEMIVYSTSFQGDIMWSKYNGPFTNMSASWTNTINYSLKYDRD